MKLKPEKQPQRIIDGAMPAELRKKIAKLAKQSKREPEDTALLCLAMGADHIEDEPWFMALLK